MRDDGLVAGIDLNGALLVGPRLGDLDAFGMLRSLHHGGGGAQHRKAFGLVELDDKGFVLTGDAAGGTSPYATSQPGIFAVGDVRSGSVKRVASSFPEGSVVISKAWAHIRG